MFISASSGKKYPPSLFFGVGVFYPSSALCVRVRVCAGVCTRVCVWPCSCPRMSLCMSVSARVPVCVHVLRRHVRDCMRMRDCTCPSETFMDREPRNNDGMVRSVRPRCLSSSCGLATPRSWTPVLKTSARHPLNADTQRRRNAPPCLAWEIRSMHKNVIRSVHVSPSASTMPR